MFKFFLYRFFNTLKEPYGNESYRKLDKFISNKELIEAILLKKKFQSLWRAKVGTNIYKETYSFKKAEIKKSEKYAMLATKFHHSFSFINSSIKRTCKEDIQYLFIIKDMKIIYMCNKEESPVEYDSILKNFSYRKSFLTNGKNNLQIQQWHENIRNVNLLHHEFISKTFNIHRINDDKLNYILDKNKIIKYARQYALNYNKSYKDFDNNGGDCTNFVSQCLHAGGLPFSLAWMPYTNPWVRVNELYYFMIKSGFNKTNSSLPARPSDIIQFHSIKKGFFSHSGIITETLSNGDCLYCCHSYNKLDYPLSEVYPLLYDKIRIINIS
jgi:hypothetical protein